MKYIRVPVYEFGPDGSDPEYKYSIIEWISSIYTNSRVDFYFSNTNKNRLFLFNEAGKRIYVDNYNEDMLYDLIEPKTEGENESEWDSIQNRCSRVFHYLEDKLPDHIYTDREIFDLYLKETCFDITSPPAWYIGDIQFLESDDVEIEYVILIEVCSKHKKVYPGLYYAKIQLENKLSNLLHRIMYDFDETICIPIQMNYEDRLTLVSKMLIALKGRCEYEEVDSLSLIRERILLEKYPMLGQIHLSHPQEFDPDDYPQEVIYDFPKEETWPEVIENMGLFSVYGMGENEERKIRICQDNIDKTIRFMNENKDFRNNVINAIAALKDERNHLDSLEVASHILRQLVIAHELGHMVFRRIRDALTETEKESLANWFACLFSDDLGRYMLFSLSPYQRDIYHDYIEIPQRYKLKKKKYDQYCEKIRNLLRSW